MVNKLLAKKKKKEKSPVSMYMVFLTPLQSSHVLLRMYILASS